MKSESDDSIVSIHSIVTDNQNFDSDNEAPVDKQGDIQKILKNHVIKEIINPGVGLTKPYKNDLITISYTCYNENNEVLEEKTLRNYLKRLKLCKGLIKAITQMRLNEKAKVTIFPKYGYRKFNENSTFDLPDKIHNMKEYMKEKAIENLKKFVLYYEITLSEILKMYDLNGKGEMMKYVIEQGKGLLKPKEMDLVTFNLTIYVNNEIAFKKEFKEKQLDESKFSYCEMIMIKSLKKGELARIEILPSYIKSFANNLLDLNKININVLSSRLCYEINLINFIENIEKETKHMKKYSVINLSKGLGNICPWRNSNVRIRIRIVSKEKVMYTSFEDNFDETKILQELSTIRKRIKTIPNHLKLINFLVDKYIREENIQTDLINLNFKLLPREIYENIINMRPLELRKISFKEIDYIKINNYELCDYKGELTVYLNVFDFVNNDCFSVMKEKEKLETIFKYKDIGNDLFKKRIYQKAKSCYKFIVDEYEREINVKEKNGEVLSNDCISVIKSVCYNLINCFFKLNKVLKAEEYIKKFIYFFGDEDEKILYLKITLHRLKNEFELSLQTSEKIFQSFPKKDYELLINEFKEKIEKHKREKDILYRKFFKNN